MQEARKIASRNTTRCSYRREVSQELQRGANTFDRCPAGVWKSCTMMPHITSAGWHEKAAPPRARSDERPVQALAIHQFGDPLARYLDLFGPGGRLIEPNKQIIRLISPPCCPGDFGLTIFRWPMT